MGQVRALARREGSGEGGGVKVLFVCMGNICRSPAAESVMRHLLADEPGNDGWELDSAGTIDYHTGKEPDARMVRAAKARGIRVAGRARQVKFADFERFDWVIAMDRENLADLRALDRGSAFSERLRLFGEFCPASRIEDVPDPYYGGADGFERVLDLMEEGCAELLEQWRQGKLSARLAG